jgi:hypothetical protein
MSAATHPLDAMAVSEANHAVILENEHVRVLDTRVRPGERTAVHAHEWPAALYVVSWSPFIRRDPDGVVLVDSRQMAAPPGPGEALWASPLPPHFVENIGETDLHIIAVEMKR